MIICGTGLRASKLKDATNLIICGTGHHPYKIGGDSEEAFRITVDVAKEYMMEHKDDIELVINGMCDGWDIAFGTAGMELGLPVESVIPFKDFNRYFKGPWVARYDALEEYSKTNGKVTTLTGCGERNQYMVDNSDKTIALWNGTQGGTSWTISMARKAGKPVVNLWSKYEEKLNAVQA